MARLFIPDSDWVDYGPTLPKSLLHATINLDTGGQSRKLHAYAIQVTSDDEEGTQGAVDASAKNILESLYDLCSADGLFETVRIVMDDGKFAGDYVIWVEPGC